VAGVARWPDPAGRLRSGPRRHRRAAGVWRVAGPLAARLPVRQASPRFGPDLRKHRVRSRTPRAGGRHLARRAATGGYFLLLPTRLVQRILHVPELVAVDRIRSCRSECAQTVRSLRTSNRVPRASFAPGDSGCRHRPSPSSDKLTSSHLWVRLARPAIAAQRVLTPLGRRQAHRRIAAVGRAYTLPASRSILLREASFSILSGLSDRKAPEP
jgi:hypothetical protein